MTQPARLALSIQYVSERANLPSRVDLRRWAKAALLQDVAAALRVVDEAEGMELNQDYRGKAYATNVLTFAYGAEPEGGPLSGDIILCAPVVEREAAEQGKPLAAHYAHLTVHGMLHLQGYDHEAEDEAVAMEAVETFIMMRLGFPDPYQDG
jgi:probable rRNA maturation factor